MNFRKKYGDAPTWPAADFDRQMQRKIYHRAEGLGMFQLDAYDHSTGLMTSFLTCFSDYSEDTSVSQYYAIEAPRGCPAREAFEVGNISWMDYWSHKGWLLRLHIPIKGGDVSSTYITMDDVNDNTIGHFKHHGTSGPLLLMREMFESRLNMARLKGEDGMEEERDYLEFLTRHRHRLPKAA